MSNEFNENNYSSKMDKSIHSLKKDISTLRTGRANTSMLDTIKVDVYGQLMPIEQLATVSVPEARLISVQVWDKANTPLIENAIQKSELGINPQIDGQIIRLRIPDLTEERRKDLIKVLKGMGEKGKIAIRNIRREANEELKKKLKDKVISEDINKDFRFADNDRIKKTISTNLGISTNQFIYLKIIRNFSFLKKFIPYVMYIKVHHSIMNLFKSDKSIKFNFSNKLKEKVHLAFEDDWTYISKKSRN